MTEELLNCPFCGGGATYVKHSAGMRGTVGFDSWDAVACRSCGGTVGACDRRFRNRADAASAWNRRPPTIPADVGRRAMEALDNLMELERRGRLMPIGREWDAARAAITELQQALAAPSGGQRE